MDRRAERKKNVEEVKKEMRDTPSLILQNIPNFLTVGRVVLTFVVAYLIFTHARLVTIIIVFVVAALTDFFDGQLARKYNWVSEFGRKADIISDRFLWIGTALAFAISFGINGLIGWKEGVLLILIMTREIISAPFAIVGLITGVPIPNARYIAKVTTFVQGFALPAIIISAYYPKMFYLAVPLSVAASITGFVSALHYLCDIKAPSKKINFKIRNKRTGL